MYTMHVRLFIVYKYAVLKGVLLISYLFNRGRVNPNLILLVFFSVFLEVSIKGYLRS